jgi:sugar lactone lactonase YvrE
MARYHIGRVARPLALVTVSALLAAGCRTGARPDAAAGARVPTVFFPDAPDRPRVQFLTSFGGAADVEAKKGGFHAFVMGKDATGKDAGEIGHPHGIAVRDGVVYVCDTSSNRIARLSFREKSYSTFGAAGVGKLRKPVNIAVDEAGYKFVADTLRQQVVVFGPDDAYVSAFALPDGGRPVDVAVHGNELFVLDNDKTPQVVVLERTTGKVLRTFGSVGVGRGQLNLPTSLAVGPNGEVCISDTLNYRVLEFTRDGQLLWEQGEAGRLLGQFARPKGIAVGPDGIVYVVEAAMELVQMFNDKGQLLMHLGGPGDGPGALTLPAAVAVDQTSIADFQKYIYPRFAVDYLLFVTSQTGPRRVSVFALGSFPEGYAPAESTIQALPRPASTADNFGPDAPRGVPSATPATPAPVPAARQGGQ